MSASALKAIKRFRTRELLGLVHHLKAFGPLPELPTSSSQSTTQLPNPFLPKLRPKSGKWHKPDYSLRRQAELVKKAHATGTMHLLPPGLKKSRFESRLQRVAESTVATAKPPTPPPTRASSSQIGDWDIPVEWDGKLPKKKVAGTELGIRLYAGKKRMFKGHRWERLKAKRIRRQSILLRDMAARVKSYKTVRVSLSLSSFKFSSPVLQYYKKRKPNPLKPSRYSKPPKLPF